MRNGEQGFPLCFIQPSIGVVDFHRHVSGEMGSAEYKRAAELMCQTGVLYVRHPLVSEHTNGLFVEAMQRYYARSLDELQLDEHPELDHQIGMTPPMTETPRDHSRWVTGLRPEYQPLTTPGKSDPKRRFMWPIGARPCTTRWEKLNPQVPVPQRLAGLAPTLNDWGERMLQVSVALSEVLAIGLGLHREEFTRRLELGPHLLGPTGADISRFPLGAVLAGVHYDFNFLTIHGRSPIRALVCWTRSGEPFLVEVPEGCLLVQAGRQLEYLTDGFIQAGMHEVDVTPETLEDVQRLQAEAKSTMRVSSNLFVHLSTDAEMSPIGAFNNSEARGKYPPIEVGAANMQELYAIGFATREELESLGVPIPKL